MLMIHSMYILHKSEVYLSSEEYAKKTKLGLVSLD
jgi:hypothetical protein